MQLKQTLPFPAIRRFYSGILLIFCPAISGLLGQRIDLPPTPFQEILVGNKGRDWIEAMAVNPQGLLMAAGGASNGPNGGSDIYFVAFDAKLKPRLERRIGRSSDDGANALLCLPTGAYLLAGYSETPKRRDHARSKYAGRRDGWLLQLDEQGNVERERLLGGPEDDELVTAAVLPDRGLLLAGNSGHAGWLLRLNEHDSVLWEKKIQYHRQPVFVHSAVLTQADEWFLIGSTEESGRPRLWMAGFDLAGNMLMETTFPEKEATHGVGIVETDRQTLAIAGNVKDVDERENAFVCLLRKNGEVLHYEKLGGHDFDEIHTLTRAHNGELLVAGSSRSFERGSRRDRAWVVSLSKKGRMRTQQYYGSKLDDAANHLLVHPDGRLFAGGFSGKNFLKSQQAWVIQLSQARSISRVPTVSLRLGHEEPIRLKAGMRGALPIYIDNTDSITIYDLSARILCDTPTLIRQFFSAGEFALPVCPKAGIAGFLPVKIAHDAPSGLHRFSLQLYHQGLKIGRPVPFQIDLMDVVGPRLRIYADECFAVKEGKNDFLKVIVKNEGEGTAFGLIMSAPTLAGIKFPEKIDIGNLAPGGIWEKDIPIQVDQLAGDRSLRLRISDASLQTSTSHTIRLEPMDKQVGPGVDTTKNYLISVWMNPNPDHFDRSEIVWSDETITVQVKVLSNRPVQKQHFCIEINGQPCVQGEKFDEVQIKGDGKHKTFKQTVSLQEGKNVLRAQIENEAGKIVSEPLTVIYSPARSNLHLLSIGVPFVDLQYTAKDAGDFSRALLSLPGIRQTFGHVFIDTLLSVGRTTKTEMLKSLRRLQYRSDDLQISPKDLVIVFVSSHGFNDEDGNFRIAASDYDSPFQIETSLDFEKEMLRYLATLPCRKLILMDACHSGSAFGMAADGNSITRIASSQRNVSLLLSCRADEFSYEDEKWGNGAFTKSLIGALADFSNSKGPADLNGDRALDVTELFKYLEREIPRLIDEKRPRPRTGQHPFLALGDGSPIIILRQ